MTKKNKHPLWEEPMKETEELFSGFYHLASKDIAEEEEDLLDIYIEAGGKKHTRKTIKQLAKIIESDMEDQEIEDLMYKKLGSEFLAKTGDSRAWLSRIRDYLKGKV